MLNMPSSEELETLAPPDTLPFCEDILEELEVLDSINSGCIHLSYTFDTFDVQGFYHMHRFCEIKITTLEFSFLVLG